MSRSSEGLKKAKIAARVIEVLDFFADAEGTVTVMDIVRQYDRPQSSTSELLQSLVQLGVLQKDEQRRSFSLTARAGLLGLSAQSSAVRDGKLLKILDALAAETKLAVLLFGRVGTRVQIIAHRAARRRNIPATGSHETLVGSAAGWLFLAECTTDQRNGLIRRLNAEASDEAKFSAPTMLANVEHCCQTGFAFGPIGFARPGNIVATMLPRDTGPHPLAVGLVCGPVHSTNPDHFHQRILETVFFHLNPGFAGTSHAAA